MRTARRFTVSMLLAWIGVWSCAALWTVDARVSRAVAVGTALSVAAAAAWKLLHGSKPARWLFLAGLAGGFALTPFL